MKHLKIRWCTWTTNKIKRWYWYFKESTKQKESVRKVKIRVITYENVIILLNRRLRVLNAFKSGIFPNENQGKVITSILDYVAKVSNLKKLKIQTSRQIFQKLLIVFAQVKAGNTFENLLIKIKQMICSLYWAKEVTKKVYNNKKNSIKF